MAKEKQPAQPAPKPPWERPPTTIPTATKGGIPPGTTTRGSNPSKKA